MAEEVEFADGCPCTDPGRVAALYIECAEMGKPWESLPMGTDSCTGIRDICAATVGLMDEMLPVARTTDFGAQAGTQEAGNLATVARYFELCDLADRSQADFDALIALLDRVFYAASVHGRLFAGKPACAVATLWRAGSISALDELNRYFTFSGMPVASSIYWNMMLNSGSDSFGEDVLRQLGENMARLVRATRG